MLVPLTFFAATRTWYAVASASDAMRSEVVVLELSDAVVQVDPLVECSMR